MDEAMMATVLVQQLSVEAQLPERASALAAGWDLRAAAAVALAPGGRALVPTGLAVALPPGYDLQIRPRSGLALRHGVTVLNAPGTIDPDYRGEVKVLLINLGEALFHIAVGDRIAQAVLVRHVEAHYQWAESLPLTQRGGGGFGHTGVR